MYVISGQKKIACFDITDNDNKITVLYLVASIYLYICGIYSVCLGLCHEPENIFNGGVQRRKIFTKDATDNRKDNAFRLSIELWVSSLGLLWREKKKYAYTCESGTKTGVKFDKLFAITRRKLGRFRQSKHFWQSETFVFLTM